MHTELWGDLLLAREHMAQESNGTAGTYGQWLSLWGE